MSVIIIGNGDGAKNAIDKLVSGSHQGEVPIATCVLANWLIEQLVNLSKNVTNKAGM